MIKLELPEKPHELTDELVQELTEEYRNTGEDVWKKSFLEKAVLAIAFEKCVYSESKLGEEGKYMEIDHFLPKTLYPNEVVTWGNLLPSNKKCNTTKGDSDPREIPFINPLVDNPKEHLYMRAYRFYGRDEKGKNTIEKTALNDRAHFVNCRSKVGDKAIETLEDIWHQILEDTQGFFSVRGRKNRIIQNLKNLLKEGDRTEEYAATFATAILVEAEDIFTEIKTFLTEQALWDLELQTLTDELNFCALPK